MRVITTGLILSVLSAPVFAGDLEDQIAFRKGYWQVVKHEFGDVMAAMLREKRPMDARRFAEAATRLSALAPLAAETFPEGSVSDESRALPEIWEDEAGFAEALATYETRIVDLQAAVNSGDQSQIGPAFKAVGGSCKNCHDNYRAE
jgi:cytochrome c556